MNEEDLRPGRGSDAPALTAIARAAKRHWGYPEPWLEAWSSALTITPAFLSESFVLVAERDTGPVGFVGLIDEGDHWLLEHLWVLPEHHGRGLGPPALRRCGSAWASMIVRASSRMGSIQESLLAPAADLIRAGSRRQPA